MEMPGDSAVMKLRYRKLCKEFGMPEQECNLKL